jgi:PIN domain nuclease of toxin-antitoxin system
MNLYVTDTHALFWYLTDSPLLGPAASVAFDEADAGQALIYIPAIVLAELYVLNEKKGHPLDFATKYGRLAQSKQFVLLPFLPETIVDLDAWTATRDMHDRMIVADARRLKAKLITRDEQIVASGVVETVW